MLNTLIFLATTLINVALLVLVIAKRRQDWQNPVILSFAGSVILFIGWFLANFLADTVTKEPAALFWTRLTVPFSLGALWFLLWFSCVFPIAFKRFKFILAVQLLLVASLSVMVMTRLIFVSVAIQPGMGVTSLVLGKLYLLMILVYLSIIVNFIINLTIKYRRLSGLAKTQIKFVLLGWSLFLIGGALVSLIIPYLASNAAWSKFGPVMSIFMVSFVTYAIIRHKLMDIRIIIQRGVIYSGLFAVIASLYILIVFSLSEVFEVSSSKIPLMGGLLTVLIGIFGVPPLERFFRRVTDRLFFKDRYDYGQTLHNLSIILNTNVEQQKIIELAQALLAQALRVKSLVIRLTAESLPVPANYVQIPLTSEDRIIGQIEISTKKSGEALNNQDLQLLQTFAYQAAVALEKAKLYEELKTYSQTLEKQVWDRTESIKKLQQQQEQMMLDIAHNLQTPLTSLLAELNYRKPVAESQKLDSLEHSITEISKFIYDLLTLARLQNKISDAATRVNFSESVGEVVEYVSILATEQGIALSAEIEPDIFILGDAQDLKTVIVNLLSNAIKYTKNQPKKLVKVRLTRTGPTAALVVSDTGRGIAGEDLPRIFERFYRARHAAAGSDQVRGSGLGLAICKAIIEKHGGTIAIDSQINQGTKIKVELPLG